ncbi:NAD-dependent protein deacetylase, SIR2 family [Caldisphaera lagunensis DSM 15908]|uniref:NAD-dependent protein deacetylase, SIR2 family n=1 Tax=Caldisphaera lagunensis (strain DSM 15908 / JCM 11604 / ANMR 0165 / IC-154) TaxID=1056495 RepID=L0AA76_CALLD|nr:NAD-dependent protein deacetylase [Caldisphaera lagunensis]AFZ70808.1 NAD-dependent protein deacetylase, SIR2 family [Caldisphaera lagunensis DSM 15908]
MDYIREIAEKLIKANFAVVLTGAGISTGSGIPDFRGPQGIWRVYDPNLFHISYFYENPLDTWKLFKDNMYEKIKDAKPNRAHYSLARLEELNIIKAVITQNIDNLHQKAGSKKVIELHGNMKFAICTQCNRKFDIETAFKEVKENKVPLCPYCGGLLKPDVIFFGEPLPQKELREAFELASESDLFLVLGSSLAVSPANQLPIIAKSNGADLIIINMGETEIDNYADIKVEGRVEDIFPKICKKIEEMIASLSNC